MHTADLGITSDVLGSLFWMLLGKMPGPTSRKEQCSCLFLDLKAYYARVKPDSQLDNLTVSMIQKAKAKSPKLRAKAAEARFLVPYALEACAKFLDAGDLYEGTVIQLFQHLNSCYGNLSQESFNADSLKDHSKILFAIRFPGAV